MNPLLTSQRPRPRLPGEANRLVMLVAISMTTLSSMLTMALARLVVIVAVSKTIR